MTENHLDAAIKTIFHQVFEVPPEAIHDDTRWGDLERWDSLGHLMLLDALREAFDIDIPPEQALEMESIREIKRIVSDLQA